MSDKGWIYTEQEGVRGESLQIYLHRTVGNVSDNRQIYTEQAHVENVSDCSCINTEQANVQGE